MDDMRRSMELMKLQLYADNASDREVFESMMIWFAGVPYVWGGSTLSGCDCSGSVCCALNVVYGTHVRVTADELFRTYFTCRPSDKNGIRALFFLNESFKAVHVAGSIGDRYFLNESRREPGKCGTVRSIEDMEGMYRDFHMVSRSLDTAAWK